MKQLTQQEHEELMALSEPVRRRALNSIIVEGQWARDADYLDSVRAAYKDLGLKHAGFDK